ncbi:MAG: hypothetical protein ACTHKA_08680 [Anaerocolumna jejuensis]
MQDVIENLNYSECYQVNVEIYDISEDKKTAQVSVDMVQECVIISLIFMILNQIWGIICKQIWM